MGKSNMVGARDSWMRSGACVSCVMPLQRCAIQRITGPRLTNKYRIGEGTWASQVLVTELKLCNWAFRCQKLCIPRMPCTLRFPRKKPMGVESACWSPIRRGEFWCRPHKLIFSAPLLFSLAFFTFMSYRLLCQKWQTNPWSMSPMM